MRKRPGETLLRKDSAEWFLQGSSESRSQKLSGTACRYHHVVLTPQTEFTGEINPRFIREGHARFENGLAAAYEVRMLVAVKADAVPQSMREGLVVWPEPGIGDDFAGSIVNCA